MIDRPYTDVAVRIVVEALATTAFAQTLEDDAHAVLAALAAEGLLVTPRIEQDARMLARALALYYGPCDVRHGEHVMRLHCYLRPGTGPVTGEVVNRYNVMLDPGIANQRATLCLPGGTNVHVLVGATNARMNEPIGWDIEQYDPHDHGWSEDEFQQLSHGRWR